MRRRRHPEDEEDLARSSEPGIHETLGPDMTVVARGARVEGTLVSDESIRIDGQAKGRIAARGDVILSSDSQVEADVQARNVVTGGTLKGNITAGSRAEVAHGGRVEGTIRSQVLVVSEGALFSGRASVDLDEARGGPEGPSILEDELQTSYEEAVRRAAEWYRSSLSEPRGKPKDDGPPKPEAPATSESGARPIETQETARSRG